MKTMSQIITEAAYLGNVGFEEMVKFYNTATDKQISKIEKIIQSGNWLKFKKFIEEVLGTKLI